MKIFLLKADESLKPDIRLGIDFDELVNRNGIAKKYTPHFPMEFQTNFLLKAISVAKLLSAFIFTALILILLEIAKKVDCRQNFIDLNINLQLKAFKVSGKFKNIEFSENF